MSGLVFQDPPARVLESFSAVLSELVQHPNRWALVAEGVMHTQVQQWRAARRRVGANGEFEIRQAKAGDAGLVDIYARYVEEDAS